MTTFVLIIFFWESSRGYAVTNVPGYQNRLACEAAAKEVIMTEFRFGSTLAICLPGPSRS